MSPHQTVADHLSRLALTIVATAALQCSAAHAAVLVGTNYAGADLTPADGDYLQGTFTNVGTFSVPMGVTVFVDPGNTLSITADLVEVDGVIDGVGAGAGGGLGGSSATGAAGSGPGGGGGGSVGMYDVESSAGGGGGYGGTGGAGGHANPPGGAGGPTYGVAGPPTFEQGSGGGGAAGMTGFYPSTGGDGGAGGAAIRISTLVGLFGPTSLVAVDGQDGQTGIADVLYGSSSGGGGSGGSILLSADSLSVEGTLSADGGRGGDRLPGSETPATSATGGGGGGGGRIKLVGTNSLCDSSTKSVAGGGPGVSDNGVLENAVAGTNGTTSSTGTACCGNGTVEGGEECDDGTDVVGDCCSEVCEPRNIDSACDSDGSPCTTDTCNDVGICAHEAAPASGCLVAPESKIGLLRTVDKKKLSWSWSKGEAFDQSILGDPLTSTLYTLCLYDYDAGVPVVAVDTDVLPSATLWTNKSPDGLQFKGGSAAPEGVTKMSVKTGDVGKTQVKFSARGDNLVLPNAQTPTFFHVNPKVTVQVVNSQGTCWTADYTLGDNAKTDTRKFKVSVKE